MKFKYILWLKNKRLKVGSEFLQSGGLVNSVKVVGISILTQLSIFFLKLKQ